jgi:hypothetical protein
MTKEERENMFGEYEAELARQKAEAPYSHPDTEFDTKHDLSSMNLPETKRENEEGFGVFKYD